MATKHIVRFWLGTRGNYNFLKESGRLDPWTRYSVKDADGSICEYFGENLISIPTGQLLPVKDIVTTLPGELFPGDRYLVGRDNDSYYIVTVGVEETESGYVLSSYVDPFDEKYTVRVLNKGNKAYILLDKKLRTYDDVDCGEY